MTQINNELENPFDETVVEDGFRLVRKGVGIFRLLRELKAKEVNVEQVRIDSRGWRIKFTQEK